MEEKNKTKIETIVIDSHEQLISFELDDSLPEEERDFVKEHLIKELQRFLKKQRTISRKREM